MDNAREAVKLTIQELEVTDPNGAPVVFFDFVTNVGISDGVINVTLAAARHLARGPEIKADAVASVFLRCGYSAALALQAALTNALAVDHQERGAAN